MPRETRFLTKMTLITFISNSSNGRPSPPSSLLQTEKKDPLLLEMCLLLRLTHKILLSNNSFRPLLQLQMLPRHNFFLTNRELNKLVVEVKRDLNFINRDNTILNNTASNNKDNTNKLPMLSYRKMVREELQDLKLLRPDKCKVNLREWGPISLQVVRLQPTIEWECPCHPETPQALL